jgi:hypothetical protein
VLIEKLKREQKVDHSAQPKAFRWELSKRRAMMRHSNETFVDVLRKAPQLANLMREIEKAEFHDESARFGALVNHMFKNPSSTNVSLNRVIIYAFLNCICKTIETKRGFILLFNEGILSPAFSLNRSIFELWGAACFVESAVRDFRTYRIEARFTKMANKLFAGARYPAELPWGELTTDKPVSVNEMIAELEKRYPKAGNTYGFLCEYCHPNFLYNVNAYLATRGGEGLWQNPRFRETMTTVLERQLSSLLLAIRGIKVCTKAISDMCLEEYGVSYS